MSFPQPAARQDQSRKVLEEVQMQKKLLKQGAATTLNPTPVTTIPTATTDSLNPAQRQALTHANTSSFGYFVAQDSSFGNIILPVIPRLDPSK